MHILLWSPQGSGNHYSGGGTFAFRLLSIFKKHGCTVDLVHGSKTQKSMELFTNQFYLHDISNFPLINYFLFLLKSYIWIYRNWNNYDIFWGLNAYMISLYPALWFKKMGKPSVIKIANYKNDLGDKKGIKKYLALGKLRRKRIGKLSKIIAISSDISNELQSYHLPVYKVECIPNGVDTNKFHPLNESKKRELKKSLGMPDLPIILFVGQLSERKRPHLILDAVNILEKKGVRIMNYFIGPKGSSDYRSLLQNMVKKYELDNSIKFVPFQNDIVPYLQSTDIFILPSSNEGMPNALLEAMSCGIPSIVTNTSGINDLIKNNQEGVYAKPNGKSIANNILWYLENKKKAISYGERARNKVQKYYSLDTIYNAYFNLFKSLC